MASQHSEQHEEVHTHEDCKQPNAGDRVVAVAVDGSAQSHYALDFYLENMWTEKDFVIIITIPEVAKALQSTWDDALFKFDSQNLKTLLEEQQKRVNERLRDDRQMLIDKKVRGKVRAIFSSNPGDTICRTAVQEKALFIVMGSRGHGMFRRTMTGSVSNYVINHSSIPVIVCKKQD